MGKPSSSIVEKSANKEDDRSSIDEKSSNKEDDERVEPVVDDNVAEVPQEEAQQQPIRKRKKRSKKKTKEGTNDTTIVEEVLSPSKSSPDSVSTDGSSSANASHQDHRVTEEEDDDYIHSFSNDYEDFATTEFEVQRQRPEQEWTTVVNRAPKLTSSDVTAKDDDETGEKSMTK